MSLTEGDKKLKRKEIQKRYRNKNREKLRQKQNEYYQENKEEIKEKAKEKIQCECGSIICKWSLSNHRKSKKHLDYILNQII